MESAIRYLVDQKFATDGGHACHILRDMISLGLGKSLSVYLSIYLSIHLSNLI